MIPKRRKAPKLAVGNSTAIRSASHCAWIRGHECAIKDRADHVCYGKIECAHVRLGSHAGMSEKPGDDHTIPLCADAHRLQHRIGEASFAARFKIDLQGMAAELARRSPHIARLRRVG